MYLSTLKHFFYRRNYDGYSDSHSNGIDLSSRSSRLDSFTKINLKNIRRTTILVRRLFFI